MTEATDTKTKAAPKAAELPKDHVKVRVLKHGAGKIHKNEEGERYAKGDTFAIHKDTALSLEDKHYVEIED